MTTTNNTKRKLLIVKRSSEKTLKIQEHKPSPNTAETFLFFVIVKNDLIHPPFLNLPKFAHFHSHARYANPLSHNPCKSTHSTPIHLVLVSSPVPPFSFRGGRFGFVVGGLRVCRDGLTTCNDDAVCRRCCSRHIILLLLQILFMFAALFPR